MRLTYAALLGALLAPGLARAQDFQRIAPETPPSAAAPVVQPPPAPAPTPAPTTVVLRDLRGFAFLPGASAVQPNGIATPGVTTAGVALLDDPAFTAQIAPFLGKPLTLADLQTITRLTNDWLRAHQHPFVSVCRCAVRPRRAAARCPWQQQARRLRRRVGGAALLTPGKATGRPE